MRVLLCSPYLQTPNVVSGGIGIWAKNVLDYYNRYKKEVVVDVVSYDRYYDVNDNSGTLRRIWYGVKDYRRSIKKTVSLIKTNNKYDVLHICTSGQFGFLKDLFVLSLAKRHNIKTVIHLHFGRIPELAEKNNREWNLFKKVAKKADSIVAIDEKTYQTLRSININAFYLPNPLALSVIQEIEKISSQIKIQPGKILFVGHVIPTKGVFELVEACCRIPESELYLIGTCTEEVREGLLSIAKDKREGKWLHMNGAIPHLQVLHEMLSCDIFVLPTYTEGFPNVILEAMACGLPIVCSNVCDNSRYVIEGENGYLFDPKDIESTVSAFERLFALSEEDYARFCHRSYEIAEHKFSKDIMLYSYIKLIEQ